MAEPFVELGATGIDKLTDKYFDTVYDRATKKKPGERVTEIKEQIRPYLANSSGDGPQQRKQRNRLPSPQGDVGPRDREFYADRRNRRRDSSLERESFTSAQVLDEYESERNDPTRKPESVLSKRDLNKLRRDSKVGSSRMSYANGYAADRPRSQQPPRGRYGYDDDDSDYDERSGRRYGATGRGYDDRDDDRGYDREVIETERYKGPARPYDVQRNQSYRTSRSYGDDGYAGGAGAVTQYRRSGEVADYESRRSGRSRSRGRRKSDRERSYSDSRSRSRSKSKDGIRGKIDETFDTSMRGLGVGIAGAIAGGLAGRQFGHKHRERDIIIGALVGGLGANAAETKWRDWKDEKERKLDRDEDRWEHRYEGRDMGRSRSAMR